MISIYIKEASKWEPSRGNLLRFPESEKLPFEYLPELLHKIKESDFHISILTTAGPVINCIANVMVDLNRNKELEIFYDDDSWVLNDEGYFEWGLFGLLDSWDGNVTIQIME